MTVQERMKVVREMYQKRFEDYSNTYGTEGALLTMSAMHQIMNDVTEEHITILQEEIDSKNS